MSGAAGGAVIIPVAAVVAIPVIGVVLIGGALMGAASFAGDIAREYEERRRKERELIRQSGLAEDIASFRGAIRDEMNSQTRLNAETSKRIIAEMDNCRREMSQALSEHNPVKYREYLEAAEKSRAGFEAAMTRMQDDFANGYRARIAETMKNIGETVNGRVAKNIGELRKMEDAETAKKDAAKALAETYLKEAESLISSLRDDFGGRDFSPRDIERLGAELNSALAQFNAGSFEASIAVAKNVSLGALNEIFESDRKRQEWENYHKHSMMIASEIKNYLESQREITPEVKKKLDEAAGRELEEELIGVRLGDYTDVLETGETMYDHLLVRSSKILSELEAATPSAISLAEMKHVISDLNGKLYPNAMTVMYNGLLNMGNAFARQGMSEKIIDFFEEHNFTFSGYGYEDDDHGKTLYLGLENATTGEELIISLAPDFMNRSGVEVKVDIDQIGGDETNEERRVFYRESVGEAVAGGVPGAKCRLECDKKTLNKLSSKTALREKLTAKA
jgi:hypothetical protein